ncbi:MAG: NHLP family bacteriocin export ABC transporter peptidase/permease/ATPase subunit [Thermoclostridium sp.]|nr:NHLP family bacteriocin export ABC transporter peptidase/permease/ATPase subunit [Thermoclostridium sp.]
MKKTEVPKPVTRGVAKVPVIMQMEALECGAACLAMIMAYYGKWLPLERVRADCGVSRDGSNARNVLKAARSYGMNASGYKYETEMLKSDGMFPCIIHWNFNHFVVLCGFKGEFAYLNDPGRGNVRITIEEFDQAFTGVCIMLEPTEGFEPGGRPRSVWAFAKERLRGTGVAFAFVIITTLISSVLGIINPAFSRIFIDRLLTGQNPDWLHPFILALAGITVISLIVQVIRTTYSLKIEGKLAIVANATFMWHLFCLPMEFFSQRMAGDISGRASSNESIASSIIKQIAPLVLDFAMLVFYLTVMIRYSLVLTLVGLLSIIINMFIARMISKRRVNLTRVQMRDAGKLAAATVSGIDMIETIKASGAENGYFEKWSGYHASVNTQSVQFTRLNQYLGAVPGLVSSLVNIVILMLGVLFTMQGSFTAGMILAFQGFMASFMSPVKNFIEAGQSMQEMRTNMERIEDVMKYPVDRLLACKQQDPKTDEEVCTKLTGELEIKNLVFGYSRLAEPIIKDFSLNLQPGKSVALVGSSGCGKSTLSKLISGLYAPWSGEILFEGKPLDTIRREVFTGSVAVVDQDIILFEDSIANNIKMWDSSIEDFEMILAARDAQLHEDIMQRDGGYRYKIMEGGRDLSGGQRQRMEIARVLAQDPTIIIMDEATSALDAKTEYNVTRAIRDRGITLIIVAHRLSTIRDCDEIVVLDKGEVMERGTHEELIVKGGYYSMLVTNE